MFIIFTKTTFFWFSFLFSLLTIAADTPTLLVNYADSADIASTISGLTIIAATVGASLVVLALTRMFYRKLKMVSRG